MYLLSVPSVSSRYFNKIKRTSYLGNYPALSLEILCGLFESGDFAQVLYVLDISGCPPYPAGKFDRVLLDVPCSALGQRPAARNRMTLKSLQSYPVYQKRFIEAVSSSVC